MATQVDITVEFVQGAQNDMFTLEATVVGTTGPIPEEIFVFDSSSTDFSHVAHAGDLDYPTSRDLDVAFYRQSSVTIERGSIEEVGESRDIIERRIQSLVDDFYNDFDTFEGTETVTIDPS